MPASLADTLAALARAFGRVQCDWYLFGAQAAILRGSRRMTADVDVTVVPGDVPVRQIIEALEAEQIHARFELDAVFVDQSRVLPMVHGQGLPVDVVIGAPGLDEYFHERAETLDVAGLSVRVPRREDLICMKLLAGRPRDMQDAEAMARAGPVDLDEIRAFVSGMADALADDSIRSRLGSLLSGLE